MRLTMSEISYLNGLGIATPALTALLNAGVMAGLSAENDAVLLNVAYGDGVLSSMLHGPLPGLSIDLGIVEFIDAAGESVLHRVEEAYVATVRWLYQQPSARTLWEDRQAYDRWAKRVEAETQRKATLPIADLLRKRRSGLTGEQN